MYIDSTSFKVERPTNEDLQRVLYCGKHKTHSIKYECCVRNDGLFVWHSKPYAGSVHDIKVFRQGGLKQKLSKGEKMIGDKGYIGEHCIITPYRGNNINEWQKSFNRTIGRNRVIIERSFGRLKRYGIMSRTFRANLERHEQVFHVCLNLTNISIILNPL